VSFDRDPTLSSDGPHRETPRSERRNVNIKRSTVHQPRLGVTPARQDPGATLHRPPLCASPQPTTVRRSRTPASSNTRDPERVAGAYSPESHWRNRSEFLVGRAEIVEFLTRKWKKELEYALRKSLWAFSGNRIAVRFQYEWHDESGQWWRSYGNENWEFDADGYMTRREASINDVAIAEHERRIFGARPESERDETLPLR